MNSLGLDGFSKTTLKQNVQLDIINEINGEFQFIEHFVTPILVFRFQNAFDNEGSASGHYADTVSFIQKLGKK